MNSSAARRLPLALTILLPLLGVLVPPTGAATGTTQGTTQGITGTITTAAGAPRLGSLEVQSVDAPPTSTWHHLHGTDEQGRFEISLAPGRYWVRFSSFSYASEWWGDAPSRGTSSQVVVEAGRFTVLDPVLEPGGTIEGTVEQAAGASRTWSERVEVLAPDPSRPGGHELAGVGLVAPGGGFSVPDLHPGSYVVRAVLESRSKLEGWWYDATTSATSAATSTPVEVGAAATTSGIDLAALHPQGVISGRVTRADGKALAGVDLSLVRQTDAGAWVDAITITTWGGGRYSVPLPSGTYRMLVRGGDTGGTPLRAEYWGEAATLETASDLPVEIGAEAVADVVLEPTQVIQQGRVRLRGTTRIGATLRVEPPRFYPASTRVSYQWLRSGRPIRGATGTSYVVRPGDARRSISVRLLAHAAGYAPLVVSASGGSAPLGLVTVRSAPRLLGRLEVGRTLRIEAPRTTPGVALRYRWFRDGRPIRGATHSTYRTVRADRGEYLDVRVVGHRVGYVAHQWKLQAPYVVR